MNFDEIIDRTGTHSAKWDMMEQLYGVPSDSGLPMWVADMDFRPPEVVQEAVQRMAANGVYGYFGDESAYRAAIRWWLAERHGWTVETDWIFTTHGLVNGTGLCIDTYTEPGDGIILLSPVYHAFSRVIRASGREVVELPLALREDRYELDIDAWQSALTGTEKMLILCSPHNPGGRVWTAAELRALADFARDNNLLLVSDEIHQDLIFPGNTHIPMAVATPDITDRLIMMSATTKTFNIAGAHVGNVIIPDPTLRSKFSKRMSALGISPNSFGLHMATAAYSPDGAIWLNSLMLYLDETRKIFDAGIAGIPGLKSMPLEGTYLAWVDFSGTGMTEADILRRVEKAARICTSHGKTFGKGGENFLRFNLATPRARVEEAIARLQEAFADLQ